ncbi:hypothetical protein [Bradyrhizobium betae]|uniref:hypothetical protein n=1 Tax=Bradyrhizobium betae TaxID=244734 RepID=UPI0013E96EF5|nr:hypothetical protein [Bradyrhizobium betae]
MPDPQPPDDRLAFERCRLLLQTDLQFRRGRGLLTVGVGQEAFEAFDELITAREVTPALRKPPVVGPDRGISRLPGALLGFGSTFKTIRNMRIQPEEHGFVTISGRL